MKCKYFVFLSIFFILGRWGSAHAEDITLLYTGETHAMLYHCNCPIQPDGGIARRATLVKRLRAQYPQAVLVDSGGFFAGGLMDEYTQNYELDMARTEVQLKAVGLMHYDALALGDDEFNFGREYFGKQMRHFNLPVLSCNAAADMEGIRPFVVKDVGGVPVGIIGVSGQFTAPKAGGITFSDPKTAVAKTVEELKHKGVKIIILLSHLGEPEDKILANAIPDIDIIVTGHNRTGEEPFLKVGNTLILRPAWQGRRFGKAILSFTDGVLTKQSVEELRLSDAIPEDPEVGAFLPRCFDDGNCKKNGVTGVCKNAGMLSAQCVMSEAAKARLIIVETPECRTCNPTAVIEALKNSFPRLEVSHLQYNSTKGAQLIRDFKVIALPAFFLGKEVDKEPHFETLKNNLIAGNDLYMIKPEAVGVGYFPGRTKVKGKVDLMVSLSDNNAPAILEAVKDFKPDVHFIVIEENGNFTAKAGRRELEEDLRAVCVQRHYPESFWKYIECRASSLDSSWWDYCAPGLDAHTIKTCAQGEEGKELLRGNIALSKEISVATSPAYLVDNQEIFSSQGAPVKQALQKVIKGK